MTLAKQGKSHDRQSRLVATAIQLSVLVVFAAIGYSIQHGG